LLEKSAQDPRIRTAAASALVAGGALAAAKVVREHGEERRRGNQETYRFEAGESPHDGVGRIARGQLELAIDRLDGASGEEDDGGEAVHEARKALKRLRTLLRLSRDQIGKQRYRHENVVFRDTGRALSGTRDSRVLLDTLDSLTERYAGGLREGLWSRLRNSLSEAAEQSSTVEPNHARDLIGVLSDARTRVETWPLPDDGGQAAFAGGFARVYSRGRRAYRAARSDQTSDALHELRKRAKDLWHATQLLEPVCPEQMKELKRDAHHVSDLLGEDHDLAILREHATRHSELLTAVELELLTAVITQRQHSLRREGLTCAGELYRQKPRRVLHEVALA
jgi:CHAD domain-containing protein